MARARIALLTGMLGIAAFGTIPTVASAHDWTVREYHSYTYESDDDDEDDDWRDHRRYRGGYDYDAPAEYRRSHDYEGRRYVRHNCRTSGTTGLIIGGALGALVGRGIDRYGDRATGAVFGAGGGALIGREIDRKHRC